MTNYLEWFDDGQRIVLFHVESTRDIALFAHHIRHLLKMIHSQSHTVDVIVVFEGQVRFPSTIFNYSRYVVRNLPPNTGKIYVIEDSYFVRGIVRALKRFHVRLRDTVLLASSVDIALDHIASGKPPGLLVDDFTGGNLSPV